MSDYPTYRVYTPSDLQTLSPGTLRTAPPPPPQLWLGLAFVILFGLVISGASFAALRYLNVDLTSSRTSFAVVPASAAAEVAEAPAPHVTPPPPVVMVTVPSETSAAHATKASRGPRSVRRHARPAAPPPPSLPPNPF